MRALGFCSWSALLVCTVCAACGGSSSSTTSTSSQVSARDQAVSAACNRFAACNDLGPSKTYKSMDDCTVQQRGFWQQVWTPKDCDGHIDGTQLGACIDTIDASECGNALDVVNISVNKCAASKVCGA